MSTHIDALERLAARGTPRGAAVLIRGIDRSLTDGPTAGLEPMRSRRRPSGPVWGVAVAALVLIVGLAGAWIAGSSDEISASGVSWNRVEAAEGLFDVDSGPGGFLSVSVPVASGVWFSPDGVSWDLSQLPESEAAFIESVLATKDRWLINGSDGERRLAWWSDDGRTWTQVVWTPPEIAETIEQVTATPDSFFAVSRDVFDEGTTLWRSEDAETWNEIPTGPVTGTSGFLEGTSGGLILYDETDIHITTDGIDWSGATLDPAADLGPGRAWIEAVDHVGGRWVAIIAVERINQDPVLAVMSSVDGEAWDFEGIPPFGRVDDLAPGLLSTGRIGDRLVVVPSLTPTSTQDDGMVVANGFVSNTRQAWSTTDGVEWLLELSIDQDILDVAGAEVDGQPTGMWIGRDETPDVQDADPNPPVVTTTAVMPDEPVDPEGLEYQDSVTEDGIVTLEEFEQTVERWKACMEEHGVTDVEVTVDRAGGWSSSYASPSPDGAVENAFANLCEASWVTQVAAQLHGN
jgi:hypothetical protein